MTFKELFSQFSFAEIRPAFLNLWQTNEPKLVEHLDLDKWERIYQNVQALETKSSQYYIRLGYRWETCSPMIDMNCSVYDKADNHLDCPMACYPSWSEIAGMEVVVETFVVGNSWYGSGGRKRYRDHATRACRRLAVGNHLLWRNGRDCTKKYE